LAGADSDQVQGALAKHCITPSLPRQAPVDSSFSQDESRTVEIWVRASIVLFLTLTFVQSAQAQVYEVGQGGTLQVREGGGAVVWRDANPAPTPGLAVPADAATPITVTNTLLEQTAARYGLSPLLLEALVWQESRWHSGAVSPKGAVGLTQLMPATASALGVNPHDPVANLDGGARYLRQMLDQFGGDVVKALAAYNAGPGRVQRSGGVPAIAETQAYVAAILARLSGRSR
jgi:soluble lytic murein transglycosylase-like protein